MKNIYEQVINSFNQQLHEIQTKNPILLDMYFCLNKLQNTQELNLKDIELEKAKGLLGFSKKQKHTRLLFGKKIDEEYIISLLKDKTQSVENLHKKFEKALKQTAQENNLTANHVLGGRLEEMKGEFLVPSINRLTQFEQKKGNFLFATTLPISKKIYAIRQGGMRRLDEKSYLFWQNNNIDLNNGIKLKKEKVVFNLNLDDFVPETIFIKNKKGDYCFYFDDEWFCNDSIKVLNDNREPIVPVEKIDDITEVLENCKIYVSQNDKLIAEKLAQKENSKQIEKCLQDFIRNNEMICVNELANKNIRMLSKEDALKEYMFNKNSEHMESLTNIAEKNHYLIVNNPEK
ncbi:MAG: hypothetical protein ACI4L7_02375 [Christensenellales bacterium]